ncbi:MAG: MGMT family protein [Myxococcales bacterium]|nr:MGMT family protein [Myxococcales bacterium]
MVKTAVQKRDEAPAPHVEVLLTSKGPQYPPGRMLVASPLEVQEVVMRIPPKRVLRLGDLRATLATKYRADYTCAMTTGLFLRIVAEAACAERGKKGPAIPYWRVVRDDGELIDKLPGGTAAAAAQLEADEVAIFHLGQRVVVANVEHYAWVPPPPRQRTAAGDVAPATPRVASPAGAGKPGAQGAQGGRGARPQRDKRRGPG